MKLIHNLVTEYAASYPEKTAVSDAFGEISYGELESKSASASRVIASFGAKPGDSIAVYVPYVKEILVGAFAALRTGCIFIKREHLKSYIMTHL